MIWTSTEISTNVQVVICIYVPKSIFKDIAQNP